MTKERYNELVKNENISLYDKCTFRFDNTLKANKSKSQNYWDRPEFKELQNPITFTF